jgi:uracil-DNA glycosylase
MTKEVAVEPEWKKELAEYFETESFEKLTEFVRSEYTTKKVFPKPADIFKAFWATPFSNVKVVILGQDPYHNDGQAEGLSFSVPADTQLPPSLQNIYKEIESDLGVKKNFKDGHLESWTTQGVFLLNAVLSVVAHSPASHQKKGWEEFTDTVIKKISDDKEHVVFMLWGNFAKSKKSLIDTTKHLVLEAAHPSPFSAHSGFFECKHFSQCNEYLKAQGIEEIAW